MNTNAPAPMPLERARQIFPAVLVVYERPADFPTGYVVRTWWGLTPEPDAYQFQDLQAAREYCHAQGACHLLPRAEDDPRPVLEAWI